VTTFTYEVGDLVKVKDPLNRETQRILDAGQNQRGRESFLDAGARKRCGTRNEGSKGVWNVFQDDNASRRARTTVVVSSPPVR
jgi:hypothetical protein